MSIDTYCGQGYFKMRRQTRWWVWVYLILLLVAAAILLLVNLGGLPIDQFKEGTTVQIAKEIWQAPRDSRRWLFPTLFGKLNLEQLPLFPDLLALAYKVGGFSPLATRLPSALSGICATAFLYGLGRELFPVKMTAVLASCVYLTLFPAIALARVGTFDAPLFCFALLTFWGLLRSRRNLLYSLIVGLGLSLTGLTHSLSLLPLTIILVLFLAWDTPRLLFSGYFYLGVILGLTPWLAWWLARWYYLQPSLSLSGFWQQLVNSLALNPRLDRTWLFHRPFARYVTTVLNCLSPWWIVSLYGLRLTWHYRNWSWAKFILVLSGVGAIWGTLAIAKSFVFSDAPFVHWYLILLYLGLILAAGIQLTHLLRLPHDIAYPSSWSLIYGCCAIFMSGLGLSGLGIAKIDFDWLLTAIFGATILTFAIASRLLRRRDRQFMAILIWGNYVSLFLFCAFPQNFF